MHTVATSACIVFVENRADLKSDTDKDQYSSHVAWRLQALLGLLMHIVLAAACVSLSQ